MDEDLWGADDRMGLSFQEHAADSAYHAHYDRPAVLAALGPVTGRRVLHAACGPGLYPDQAREGAAGRGAFAMPPAAARLADQVVAQREQDGGAAGGAADLGIDVLNMAVGGLGGDD
jgi:hypothetical protein